MRNHEDLRTNDSKLKAHFTWTAEDDRPTVNLSGSLIYAKDGIKVDGINTIRRKNVIEEDMDNKKRQIIEALMLEYNEKTKGHAVVVTDDEETPIEKAFRAIQEGKMQVLDWDMDSTQPNRLKYCSRLFIPFIKNVDEDDDFGQSELLELKEKLREDYNRKKRKDLGMEAVDSNVSQRLYEFQMIYNAMQFIDPSLPRIKVWTAGDRVTRIPNEQLKVLTDAQEIELRRRIEAIMEEDPVLTRAAAFMYSGALRAAEAASVTKIRIEDYGSFVAVWVLTQEQKGKIMEKVKSHSGFRRVILESWGSKMVRKCNALIAEEDAKNAPVLAKKVSAWIRKQLIEIGVKTEDMEKTDIAAHLLRRHRASIWRNICGFSQWEIDYLLGHKNPDKKYEKCDPKSEETMARWAEMISRYAPCCENGESSGKTVVSIDDNTPGTLAVPGNYRLNNNSDKEIEVRLTLESAEAGEAIFIDSKAASMAGNNIIVGGRDSKGQRKNTTICNLEKMKGDN